MKITLKNGSSLILETVGEGKGKELVIENFPSISKLLNTLDKREKNEVMSSCDSSHTNGKDFSLTSSYEEACSLLKYGYVDILEKIEKERKKTLKENSFLILPQQTPPTSMPIGYIPHVPNAIQNLPNSMINTIKTPKKAKSISIVYSFGESCREEADSFVTAGIALISAINLIERCGIRTKLSIGFFPSTSNSQIVFPTLTIKNYEDNFNIKKICFPIAHPSMFRRIGFRYCETCPNLTDSEFAWSYGHPIKENDFQLLKKELNKTFDTNCYLISFAEIKKYEYKVNRILNHCNIKY